MNRAQIIGRLKAHQGELAKLGVAHLALFGSAARGTATSASDIDVIVDSPTGEAFGLFRLARIAEQLETLFGCPADAISRKGLNHACSFRQRIAADIVDVF